MPTCEKFISEIISNSPEETKNMGRSLGEKILPGSIIAFLGELGAGKTTFIKGVVQGVGKYDETLVTSPTFTYLNIYETPTPIYHFDLYRLPTIEQFYSMGFDEYLFAGGITLIEWADPLLNILPKKATKTVQLFHVENSKRKICLCEI